MRVLLDTHAFLWFVAGDAHLSRPAHTTIADPSTEPYLSVASIWEMAIKISLGKLSIGAPFSTFIPAQLRRNGISLLGITVDHAAQVTSLPFNHRDPFDRLIVAQAMVEQMPIASADAILSTYPVTRIW